jgi:magnesium transporter
MINKNPLLVPELREMMQAGDSKSLRDFCESGHPAIIAEMISALSSDEAWKVLLNAESSLRSEIFSHLDIDTQVEIVGILNRREIAFLLSDMYADDRADLFKQLPEELRENVLPALAQAEREDIRRLSAYREGTAGAAMTSEYVALPPNLSASQAIDRLREVAPDKETIYYAYVVDESRKLLGQVSLRDLIIARRETLVGDIMNEEVVFARTEDDQEDVARKIQKLDLIALPVVNGGNALVGIVTHDDAMDIISQEQTEDIEKLMAIVGTHEDAVYMKTSSWGHFRNRYPWVIALAFLGLVSGFIVQSFEGLLMQFTILAAFMPMLADTGGNTGSQSATLVVRALALKEVTTKDILRILAKEFGVAIMLALLLGVIAFGRVFFFSGGMNIHNNISPIRIAFAIALALGLQVITSTLVGALLPLGAARMKWDPAVVASPALTTIVDITGLLIFFSTAKLLLGI